MLMSKCKPLFSPLFNHHYVCSLSIALVIGSTSPLVLGQEQAAKDALSSTAQPVVTMDAVRKLLRALESNQLKDRDVAEQALVELGPAVLAFLPEVNANTSGEMKVRLQRIRQQLQLAVGKSDFNASTVTLSGKMPLKDALLKIEEQTGNKIVLEGENALDGVQVDLMEMDSPFWETLAKVMSQAKLRVNTYTAADGLALVAGTNGNQNHSPKPAIVGPFRIETLSVQSTLAFNSRISGQLDLSLQVTWEPRLKPVFMQIPMSAVQGETDDMQTLASANPQSVPEVPLNTGGASTQIDLQLERPSRSATKLSTLQGEFTIAVPSEKHKYVFRKFGNGARQSEKFGDVSVTLEGARRNGSVYEMRILVEFGNAQGALDSFRGWILSNEAYLLDPRERRLENVGLQTYAVTPNAVGIAYLFQINGNPDEFQLVYESPGLITRQTVKFELHDIELP
jgi:hypothetical protein